ncbi:LacI family DNA-binding transcriptional regulator [Alteromonas sp. a30]|uniref:LacI family DNA-binding transcriptional regulator n=1 Tax=Alteromonas sp. a30 TaxID=2730917 RepID=UPI002280E16A|nr:LacI family DNA-binding transcriptional regulator [Alteromonas sp. a30]MCY7294123.1 LacI family DNA-binding transcriptional regulator [Alteromonas sp. a30]
MKDKATSFDIAHMAGVSQSTVSRALRNSPLVSIETRNKIKEIAKQLNYKVDKNASNLRQQQSKTIALLLFEDPTSDDSKINPFFLTMLGSITRASADAGYDLLISFQQFSNDWHADFEDTHKADGIILLGYGDFVNYQDKIDKLVQQSTHFVRWGAINDTSPGITIGGDNYNGGRMLTEHLLALGHQRFVFIGGANSSCPEFLDRFNGFKDALCHAGVLDTNQTAHHWDAISTETSGYNVGKALIESGEQFDAIVCASDMIAVGVMSALQEADIRVPDDVAVVGYDNIPLSKFTSPPLTTIRQNTQLAGRYLVDALVKLINKQPAENISIPGELVTRRSCGSTATPNITEEQEHLLEEDLT